jgi:5-hydroxyisourate hydrolase
LSGITTHVLDTSTGLPATAMAVRLYRGDVEVAAGVTDGDGRWVARERADTVPATYRLVFVTGEHFGGASFHPRVTVEFTVSDPVAHHHVPLLLSPYGYTTYRGS